MFPTTSIAFRCSPRKVSLSKLPDWKFRKWNFCWWADEKERNRNGKEGHWDQNLVKEGIRQWHIQLCWSMKACLHLHLHLHRVHCPELLWSCWSDLEQPLRPSGIIWLKISKSGRLPFKRTTLLEFIFNCCTEICSKLLHIGQPLLPLWWSWWIWRKHNGEKWEQVQFPPKFQLGTCLYQRLRTRVFPKKHFFRKQIFT